MEIIPFIGTEQVTVSSISVKVNPDDRARAETLVLRTGVINRVEDKGGFNAAKKAAGELKAMIDEIADSKKAAKRPFSTVEAAIEQLATEVLQPVADEHKRILAMLNGYVARLEALQKEEERKKIAQLQQQIEAERAKLREAQLAQLRAEEQARKAQDEASRLQAQEEIRRRAEAAEQAQLAAEMAGEISQIGQKPKPSLVPGGRVGHKWDFVLTNVRETVKAGCWNLLRWELDKLACQDSCKAQLEIHPDAEPTLPGIQVTRTVNVSVRASAKIT
jgi:predicted DNA-binding protein YlxM (UPF0122 family)